ncbi:MAG: TlpA disulfide reductase family protein [Marinilabiliaceae bacterium]|nr:TlpA disulfide reductase family protein [Marinilabiliaceae bacterium]
MAQQSPTAGLDKMPGFKLHDSEGELFNSESIRGKYVLIDFWASWCGPCHKKFPELIELYTEFHIEGLEIVGISTDFKKEPWLADLEKLDLPWIQLIDMKGEESVAVTRFGVSAIPALFFIGPEGKIIARDPGCEFVKDYIRKEKNKNL